MSEPTAAQRLALQVLQKHGTVRVSSSTSLKAGCVYWQTARWLRNKGYARSRNEGDWLGLTEAGKAA